MAARANVAPPEPDHEDNDDPGDEPLSMVPAARMAPDVSRSQGARIPQAARRL
jgi:hypothetical protein